MTVNEFLKSTIKDQCMSCFAFSRRPRPHVVCKDGYSISIQANSGTYCVPRENDLEEYEAVELGFPNQEDPLILDYAEDPYDLTGTVYGYVPVEIVDQLLEKHGGIDYIIKVT